jgi:cyanophycinase
VVWVDEGDGRDWGSRWAELLASVGPLTVIDVAVPIGSALPVDRLHGCDGVFVCGGLTPAYAAALAPAADHLRALVLEVGVPYAGSSAGAAVAATTAVVGGWLDGETVLCPEDAAEDLDQLTVMPGLGLLPELVDVHASAWGTLPRLAAAVQRQGSGAVGLGLDEDTAWHVTDTGTQVLGRNSVHRLAVQDDGSLHWKVRRPATGR